MMQGTGIGEMIQRGLKLTRSMAMLGGQSVSSYASDLGVPVGAGYSNPSFACHQLAHGNVNQPNKIGRSITADLDITYQGFRYLVAYNPLGVSQGIVSAHGSRMHLPGNVLFGLSLADSTLEVKMNTPTEEKPLSYLFTSRTSAVMYEKDDSKALAFLKDTCVHCENSATVTRGEQFCHGQAIRENVNANLGMESNIAVYNCETYIGKAFFAKVSFESFKPSEINSHGSIPGFFLMGLMQTPNYFYQYSPYGMCSMKAVTLRSRPRPSRSSSRWTRTLPSARRPPRQSEQEREGHHHSGIDEFLEQVSQQVK